MRHSSEVTPWVTEAVLVLKHTTSTRTGSSLGLGKEKGGVPQGKNPVIGLPREHTLEKEQVVLTWPRASFSEP